MKRILVLGTVLAMASAAGYAQTAPAPLSADQYVAVRKAVMQLQQGSTAAMKAAVDGKATSVKAYSATAKGIVTSSEIIPLLFPAGTEKANGTKAKAEIWSDQAGFTKASNELTDAAKKVVAAADADDPAAFATAFGAMGRSCGACHRNFKERD